MFNITVILTCYNRKDKTYNCIERLVKGNKDVYFRFVVVDDNSTDGTSDMLKELPYGIEIIHGNGSLFWAGGMREGIRYFLNHKDDSDYILLVNDDVQFFDYSIDEIVAKSQRNNNAVIVGATCDNNGNYTYGGRICKIGDTKGMFRKVYPGNNNDICDTFNANCVLIKSDIFYHVGNFDPIYRHALADFDYGLMVSRMGYIILSSEHYVGICSDNARQGTWNDKSLSRITRIKLKESIKGAPFKEWFHFLHKNFSLTKAIIFSSTPYIRIILKK